MGDINENGDEFWEKIRRWQMRRKCKGDLAPGEVLQKHFFIVDSLCMYPRVTLQQPEICVLHQWLQVILRKILYASWFYVFVVFTYLNSALGRMMRTIDEVNLKMHLRVDLSILGLMCCPLECKLASCDANFLVGFALGLFYYSVGLSGESRAVSIQMSNVFRGAGTGILSAFLRNPVNKNPSSAIRSDRYEKKVNFVYRMWGYLW